MNASDSAEESRPRSKWSYFAYAGLITSALLVIAAFVVSNLLAEHDNAGANAAFAIGILCAGITLYFSIVLSSRFPAALRLCVALLPVLSVVLAALLLRFEGLSGELVPQFKWRWDEQKRSVSSSIASDQRMNTANASPDATKSSDTPTPDDPSQSGNKSEHPFHGYSSTQFFGESRNGVHNEVILETDWTANPPKELWRIPIGKGWASFAVRAGIAVTLEQSEDGKNENVLAVDLATGKPRWLHTLIGSHYRIEGGAGPRTTPTIDGDYVYVLSSAGKLTGLRLETGELLWEKDLLQLGGINQELFEKEVSWGRSGSPLIVREFVVVPMGGALDVKTSLMSFNKLTGGRIWNSGHNQVSYSSPVLMTLEDVPQIVYVDEKTAAGYTIVDGTRLWEYSWSSNSNADASASQAVQIDSNSLLLSKGYFQGCARIQVKKDGDNWKVTNIWDSDKSLKTKFTSCVLHANHAFGLNDGKLECVNLDDGKRAWMKGRYGHGQILLCNDILLISSEDGELILVAADPTQHRELAKLKVLDGVTWNIPTMAKDIVITRNSSEAVCLQLPTKSK